MQPEPSTEAVRDEERRARRLRTIVDLTCNVLMQGHLDRNEAETIVAEARRCALDLFPDKADTFDLVLAPRFARLMDEFTSPAPRRSVLPFRPRR